MKYGFECEYWCITEFCENTGPHGFVLTPDSLPKDECGYLAEVRGEPHCDPYLASALFKAEEARVRKMADKAGVILYRSEATFRLPARLLWQAMREHGKPSYPQGRGNIYGKDYSIHNKQQRAALHVHFSNEIVTDKVTHSGMIDMVKYIQALDKAFAGPIKEANRLPGFYEMKPHGFEYRSLPCTVGTDEVAEVISNVR